jgi:predicted  nucleic acid-binding Zn-ribbon protein
LRADFQKAWLEGRKLYQARVDVANLERELAQKNARLSEVKSRMVSVAASQFDGNLTSVERIELATQVQQLNEERQTLRADIPRIESELEIRSRELDRLTTTLASVVY